MPGALLPHLRALAGGRCAVCRGGCRGALCAACVARCIPPVTRCAACAMALPAPAPGVAMDTQCRACRARGPAWSRATCACDYGPPWDRLIAALKFQGRLDLASPLAGLLSDAVAGEAAEAFLGARLAPRHPPSAGRESAPRRLLPTLVVPVPLAPGRLRERGYNQAWELARRVARWHRLPALPDVLFRVRDTGHQLSLARARRAGNLAGAFVVTPSRAPRVRGAAIALVDDVLTTGATADAAARALRAAGAADVRLWVVARTP